MTLVNDDRLIGNSQFFQKTLDCLASNIAVLDKDGTIIAVNTAWNKFASDNGLAQVWCGVNYLRCCDQARGDFSEEAKIVADGIRDVVANRREYFYMEYPCHSPQEHRWFSVRITRFEIAQSVRIVVTHDNITQRILAELKLKEANRHRVSRERRRRVHAEHAQADSEQRLLLIADALPVLIAYVDRNQRYQFNNKAFQAWFGIDAPHARGRAMREVVGERLYRIVSPHAEKALAGQQVKFAGAVVLDNGRRLAIEGVHVPDQDERGDTRGFYSLIVDVTERDQARGEARQLRAELAHAGRVSLMGVLAGAMAHELNQPLTAIMSNAQAARRFLDNPAPNLEEVAEILDDIVRDDERASEVIRRLRALVKKDQADVTRLDVVGMVQGVERIVHHDAMLKNIAVAFNLDGHLPQVRGDRVQLQQVLLNLITNAFDSIEGSSSKDRTVTVTARGENRKIVIEVRDTGCGIANEMFETLFEPFKTSKNEGLGIGLSISRSIVEQHGGRLWAENNPTGGATFHVSLPAYSAEAAADVNVEDMKYAETACDGVRGR
jgi:two-component system, LuxR family, sensor kinase FixL